ncbi:helix-turn-helix domain-containing protein [Lacisediminihabitans sp. H27-G8]|uniref:helix-turn-helix domain-containing protein n=1 Tax=Lacisediminihabitans sp. H27-G8 TaxID=3111909 RepID=UPI0038FC6FDC
MTTPPARLLARSLSRRSILTIPLPNDQHSELRHPPQQQRSRATLERLENAARRVLAQQGRDEFTTAQVANAANVSIGTLYRYFPDRTAILDHVWPDRQSPYIPPAEAERESRKSNHPDA